MGQAINCGGCNRSVIDELAVLWDDVRYCVACVSSFLIAERELRKKAEREHRDADAAWQSSESRLVRICQLLGVDFTCEEPETCEQVIERLLRGTDVIAAGRKVNAAHKVYREAVAEGNVVSFAAERRDSAIVELYNVICALDEKG